MIGECTRLIPSQVAEESKLCEGIFAAHENQDTMQSVRDFRVSNPQLCRGTL
jgi:hypothetical protein